jgi:CheY-like chemotaxis protein
MHILIVEDQKLDRFISKKLLSPFFEVTTLSSATEAVSFALSNQFDIALINVMLNRDLDSIELLQDLQFIHAEKFIPYAITCHIDATREDLLLKAGFRKVIRKPFDLEFFVELLKEEEYKFHSFANYINVNRETALF